MKLSPRRLSPTPRRLVESAGRLVSLAAALSVAAPALAEPTGGQLVHGTGHISQNGSVTTITAGNNSIFNFRSFNIGAGETVRFVQPGAESRVLNRITGPDPSRIAGTLQANGMVYIVNPAGVYFAHGALVNVGGIYAAAGHLSDADFRAGNNHFTALSGTVRNDGTINGASVNLIGAKVANFGEINAPRGMVTMTAGNDVYIGEQNGHIFARVSGGSGDVGVTQAGNINAQGGQVRLGAGDMYAVAIDHPGRTAAKDIALQGGRSGVVQVAGTLDASDRSVGGVGGTVSVLGDKVGLFGGEIDASGDAGGGTVHVGGGPQGHGAEQRASATYLSADSSIKADAVTTGNGGQVVVWSDHVTRAMGDISARGGAASGNGGFVETSGKQELTVARAPKLGATGGRGGRWLIDPHDITIVPGSGNTNIPSSDPFEATGDDAQLGVDLIKAALTGGANVTISTGTTGTQPGDITLATNLDFDGTGTNTLTMSAARDIVLNGDISDSAAGADKLNLALTAGRDVHANGLLSLGGGDLTVSGGAFLNSASAIDAGAIVFNNAVVLQSDTTVNGATSVTFNSTVDSVAAGNKSLTVNSPLTAFNGAVGAAAADTALGGLTTDAAGSTTLNADAFNAGTVAFHDDVIIGADAAVTGTTSVAFDATINSQASEGNDLTINSPSTTLAGAIGQGPNGALGFFKTDAAGSTTLSANVKARRVEFDDAVVLGASSTLTGTASVVFRGTVNSQAGQHFNLTLSAPAMNFNGQVGTAGADTGLGTLATANGNGFLTTLNSAVMKAQTFDFHSPVLLAFNAVLNASNSAIFNHGLDSRAAEHHSLTVNSPSTTFAGVIGGGVGGALGTLSTDSAGTTTFDSGAVTADAIDLNDAVELARTTVFTGGTSVRFGSTLDSRSGIGASLTINSPLTTFAGIVGGAGVLGDLATDGAGTTGINTSSIHANSMRFSDAVVLGAGATLTADEVNFGSTVDSQTNLATSLTVNARTTSFGGAVGGGTGGALGALTTDAAGSTTVDGAITAASVSIGDTLSMGGGSVTTTGDQVYGGPVTLRTNSTLSGHNITFNGTVDSSLATGDRSLTVNTSNNGVTRFNAAVGGSSPLASLTTNIDGTTIVGGGSVVTSGDQTYNEKVILTDNASFSGNDITFNDTVDSDSTPRSLTVDSTGGGVTLFTGALGGSSILASVNTNSDGTTRINGGSVKAQGVIAFNDATLLGADTTLDGQSIAFGGTLNSDVNTRNLVALTHNNGATTFNGAVGNATPIRSIATNADGITQFFGSTIRTTGNQTYHDPVQLGANMTLTGANVTFLSTIDSTALLLDKSLTVNVTGSGVTTFRGAVGSANALSSLTTDANGTTRVGANITTSGGGVTLGDNVRLFGDVTITDTGSGGLAFGGTIDSEGTGRALSLFNSATSNATAASPTLSRITFAGNIGSHLALSSLRVGPDRQTNPNAATIGAGLNSTGGAVSNYALSISTTGDFTMGAGQKFTVVGGLTINAGGTATLGDISTLGNLAVNAPSIVINSRPGGPTLGVIPGGGGGQVVQDSDLGVDFVSGGTINFSTTPTVTGGFTRPAFATPDSLSISQNLSGFTVQSFGPVAEGTMHSGSNYVDLKASGPTNTNVAPALAGALPTQGQSGTVSQDTGAGRAQQEELALLGIRARTPEQRELLDNLMGVAFYFDVPPGLGASDTPISVSRLPASIVSTTLEAYRAVFWRDGKADPGHPSEVLTAAWKEYSTMAGSKADALGFRAYCESVGNQAEAVYYLNGLRDLFAKLGYLGLSAGELRVAKSAVLRAVPVQGMTTDQLEAAIVATNMGAAQ